MALFKHKENIPELPIAPSLNSRQKSSFKSNINELPTLPPLTKQNDDFGQEMVKSAIGNSDDFGLDKVADVGEQHHNDSERSDKNTPHQNTSMIPQNNMQQQVQNPPRKTVFVKVEKFHALQDALSEIQEQIKNLSRQVQTLKDVKTRQVQEINVWDEEMKKINQRLSKIDSGIFGDV